MLIRGVGTILYTFQKKNTFIVHFLEKYFAMRVILLNVSPLKDIMYVVNWQPVTHNNQK